MADGIGLSVGAANLTAVAVDRAAIRRSAVITLYPHRPPEVGVPRENPNLAEPGVIITDFVDRVGDPIGLVAADGTSHRAETLLADGLRAMFGTVARGPSTEPVGVSYPAHWRPSAVDALRGALAAVPEFGTPGPPLFTGDAVAALTALQQDPGVPSRGVIALCDFGGTGTSITLADAADGFRPIVPTVRHLDLSGEKIDQALLTHVIAGLSAAGSIEVSGTSAIGSLTRLRTQCRAAKERLSTASVTALPAGLPGHNGEIRITRTELDDAIRASLAGFADELQDTLQHSGIRPADLVAVASTGGGARMPIITTTLSEHLRVPVITGAHPELTAAIGGAILAVRGTVVEGATSMAPLVAPGPGGTGSTASPSPSPSPPLAWSDADDVAEVASADDYTPDADPRDAGEGARPQIGFAERDTDDDADSPPPWYRRPRAIIGGALAVLLAAIAAAIVFVDRDDPGPSSTTVPTTSAPPTTSSTPPAPPLPAPPIVTQQPPPVTVTERPPPPAPPPPAPATSQPPPASPPPAAPPATSEPPPPPPPATSEPPPPPPPFIPTIPPIPTIPGLPPFIPQPGQGFAP